MTDPAAPPLASLDSPSPAGAPSSGNSAVTPPSSGNFTPTTAAAAIQKLQKQNQQLQAANQKYKQLLHLAKERILKQQQEQENSATNGATAASSGNNGSSSTDEVVVRVVQRVREESSTTTGATERSSSESHNDKKSTHWALLEWRKVANDEGDDNNNYWTDATSVRKAWHSFPDETALMDYCRHHASTTAEPLGPPPPYSLTATQAEEIRQSSAAAVTAVTEEFRRFRVRSQLQQSQQQSRPPIVPVEPTLLTDSGTATTNSNNNNNNNNTQESIWRERLEAVENKYQEQVANLRQQLSDMQQTGAAAAVAAQWRQRYEQLLETTQNNTSSATPDDWEARYHDLKESFRLYRKKAKQVFQEQQDPTASTTRQLHTLLAGGMPVVPPPTQGGDGAKLSYLKNLMVHYLTASDAAMRQHMQGAISTVLQFTPEDSAKIEAARAAEEAWFYA